MGGWHMERMTPMNPPFHQRSYTVWLHLVLCQELAMLTIFTNIKIAPDRLCIYSLKSPTTHISYAFNERTLSQAVYAECRYTLLMSG